VTSVEPETPVPARRPLYRRRFVLLYALLVLLVAAGAAGFVFLVNKPAPETEPASSEWEPRGIGLDRAREIAAFVSSRYLLPSGKQLVEVRAGPPVIRDVPLAAIGIKASGSSADVQAYPATTTILYILCGDIEQQCAIPEGESSTARGRVLRREGLELALYTFKYMAEIDSVFEFMPPPLGEEPTAALFFRREDLAQELEKPVSDTLSAPPPYVSTGVASAEVEIIDRLTGPRQFTYVFGELEDGSAGALLTPLAP